MEEKVAAIIAALQERYPDALCALHYGKNRHFGAVQLVRKRKSSRS